MLSDTSQNVFILLDFRTSGFVPVALNANEVLKCLFSKTSLYNCDMSGTYFSVFVSAILKIITTI